jgi:cytochrome c oxidase subunit IV
MAAEKKGNWWIWRVFLILLFITAFEVVLGILKVNEKLPEFIVYDKFLGLAWLTHIFIILTIFKAAYIVMTFMHLGHEKVTLKWTILMPALILVPYLLFILFSEALYTHLKI